MLPPASVCFCQLPPGPASGRFRPVWLTATSLWILTTSGGHIWKLNKTWAKLTPEIDRFNGCFPQFSASVCFRQLPQGCVSGRPGMSGAWRFLSGPDFCFRQLPSASVSFRRGPRQTARHVWIMPTSFCALMMSGGSICENSIRHGQNLRPQSTDSMGVSPNSLLPSASAGVRVRSARRVWILPTSFCALMMSGDQI